MITVSLLKWLTAAWHCDDKNTIYGFPLIGFIYLLVGKFSPGAVLEIIRKTKENKQSNHLAKFCFIKFSISVKVHNCELPSGDKLILSFVYTEKDLLFEHKIYKVITVIFLCFQRYLSRLLVVFFVTFLCGYACHRALWNILVERKSLIPAARPHLDGIWIHASVQ